MIFDDELELDEYETFEAPHGTLACPVCGHAVCTFIGLDHVDIDPCGHVILVDRAGEATWSNRRLAAKFHSAGEDLSPEEFLDREGIDFTMDESVGSITVFFIVTAEV